MSNSASHKWELAVRRMHGSIKKPSSLPGILKAGAIATSIHNAEGKHSPEQQMCSNSKLILRQVTSVKFLGMQRSTSMTSKSRNVISLPRAQYYSISF